MWFWKMVDEIVTWNNLKTLSRNTVNPQRRFVTTVLCNPKNTTPLCKNMVASRLPPTRVAVPPQRPLMRHLLDPWKYCNIELEKIYVPVVRTQSRHCSLFPPGLGSWRTCSLFKLSQVLLTQSKTTSTVRWRHSKPLQIRKWTSRTY